MVALFSPHFVITYLGLYQNGLCCWKLSCEFYFSFLFCRSRYNQGFWRLKKKNRVNWSFWWIENFSWPRRGRMLKRINWMLPICHDAQWHIPTTDSRTLTRKYVEQQSDSAFRRVKCEFRLHVLWLCMLIVTLTSTKLSWGRRKW